MPPPTWTSPAGAPQAPTRVAELATQVTAEAASKGPDLTLNKVLAGAGAAATSAVLGSFFGAAGTVTGAAFGSVLSTVAATLYQRSLDRTRDRLAARIRAAGKRGVDVSNLQVSGVAMPMPRVSPEGRSGQDHATESRTVQLRVEPSVPARPQRRRFVLWAAATVLIFALGLLAVTGIEWAKGSTLTAGESGTSVGRVIEGGNRTTGGDERVDPTTTPEPSSTSEPSADPSTDPSPSSTADPSAEATPSDEPDSGSPTSAPAAPGGDDGSGSDSSGRAGLQNDRTGRTGSGDTSDSGSGGADAGGSAPTPAVPVPAAPGG